MLCLRCQQFSIVSLFWDEPVQIEDLNNYFWHETAATLYFQHSDSILSLQQKAIAGCRLCKLVLSAIDHVPVAQDEAAKKLPIVLYLMDAAELGVALVSDEEGLLKLCTLDVSWDTSELPSR